MGRRGVPFSESDRVKIDNSLPAGGRTSGYRLRDFGAISTELSLLWRFALLQRRQRRERMARPDRRPAARRTRRRACADRDRFPEAETRSPRAPRSTTPSCSVSGGSSASTACSSASARRRRGLRQEQQVDRLVDLAFDRLQRHHAVLHDRRLDPADHPQPVGAVPRQIEAGLEPRQRRERRASLAMAARVAVVRRRDRHAARSPGRPRPRPEAPGRRASEVFRSLHRSTATASGSGNSSSARASASGGLPVEPPARLAHIGSQPPGAQRRLGDAEDIARDGRLERRRIVVGERALVGLGAAVERLRRRAASPWAPQGRPRPFRGNCRRCPGRTGRTAAGRSAASPRHACAAIAAAPAPGAARSCPAGRRPCPARRNRDRTPGIAPAPRSCHRGRQCCGSAGSGGRGAKS